MRNAFADEITKLAEQDEKIVLLSGDIGNRLFDKFKEKFPERFYNCGVAEANMIGVCAGLAHSQLKPVAYTIVSFLTTKTIEQIRLDLAYHNFAAVLVGVGGGFSYSTLNATHHSCEEVGFLRMIPNMTVLCPADPVETRLALRAALKQAGPVYIRIGKKGEPVIHQKEFPFTIGKAYRMTEGGSGNQPEVCFLNCGLLLPVILKTKEELEKKGVHCSVVSFHTVKPLDEECLKEVFSSSKLVVTAEEHSRNGGLGGSVAEWLCDHPNMKARLLRVGTPDKFFYPSGEQEFARQYFGLTPEKIASQVLLALKEENLTR